jgi:hypothetical protein
MHKLYESVLFFLPNPCLNFPLFLFQVIFLINIDKKTGLTLCTYNLFGSLLSIPILFFYIYFFLILVLILTKFPYLFDLFIDSQELILY